jgi:TonB family protein
MQTLLQLTAEAKAESKPETFALSSGGNDVDLAVHWSRPGREFASSLRAFFSSSRPPRDEELPADRVLRAHWIRGRIPAGEFSVSVLWHVAVIWILILPIWGFLPKPMTTLPPVQIELTYYPPADLPPISLPAEPKPHPAAKKEEPKPAAETPDASADEAPARQTIISIPVRITHPRQTLIQPHAPDEPPKVAPALPNIVQWPEQQPAKPKLEYTTAASVPKARERAVRDVDAPDALPLEKNSGPIDIASQTPVKLQPQLTVPAMVARATARHTSAQPDAAVPDAPPAQGAEPQALIALSASPAPPAPSVAIPQGNLAARIAVSPDGTKAGAGAAKNGASGGNANGSGATNGSTTAAAGGAGSLPASIYVGPGKQPAKESGGIGPRPLDLGLRANNAAPAPPASPPRADVSRPRVIQPGEPPEKVLSGKEVYTLHLNLPNLTSSSGSWVLSFAQLDEGLSPAARMGELSGPAPLETVDPKYPQDMINEHVHGQVVLYAIIRKDGSVDSIQLVQSLDPVLDKNAIRALGLWKFSPGRRAGMPVDLEAVVYIPFEYRNLLQ